MGISQEVAEKTYELILPCYSQDGNLELETIQASLDTLGAEQGVKTQADARELYGFRLVG